MSISELQRKNERYFAFEFKRHQRLALFEWIEEGDLSELKRAIKENPEWIHTQNKRGEGLLFCALKVEKYEIVLWLMKHLERNHLDVFNDGFIPFALYADGLIAQLFFILEQEPSLIHFQNSKGKTLFHLGCRDGNHVLIERLLSLDQSVVFDTDHEGRSGLHIAFRSKIQNREMIRFLVIEKEMKIHSEDEFKAYVNAVISFRVFDEDVFIALLNQESLKFFFKELDLFSGFVKSEKAKTHLEMFRQQFPCNVRYEPKKEESLHGEDLIRFYDKKIPDVKEFSSPYEKLKNLFFSLTKTDYVAQMSLGSEDLISKNKAKKQRKMDQKAFLSLFNAIEKRKPDVAIPFGKENLYYPHLEKILKHVAKHLHKGKNKEENFVFLKDFVACSQVCYTHFSTVIHSMYVRVSQDSKFHEVQQKDENPSDRFFSKLAHFYKSKVVADLSRLFQEEDIHVIATLQKILVEGGYPIFGEKVIDRENMELGAIIQIREQILDIDEQDTLQLLMSDEKDLYAETKKGVLRLIYPQFSKVSFFYETLKAFLNEGLNKEGSENFLYELIAWLESVGIDNAHKLLKYNKNETYTLKDKGLMLILQKMPKTFPLT